MDSPAPVSSVRILSRTDARAGAPLIGVSANRWMRCMRARYSRRGTATSASWNVTYRA
jgi:hypothetical protein